jgi:uncharacterized protein
LRHHAALPSLLSEPDPLKLTEGRLRLAATDLSNHLACPHTTTLDRARLAGLVKVPPSNPDRLERLRERGLEHEQAYLDHLAALGRSIASVPTGHDVSHDLKAPRTLELMRSGIDVIAQAAFADDRWGGYADVLLRVDTPSDLGPWSYEVADTKLTQNTKAGTILQLCLYADLLTPLQGRAPEYIHVITPGRGFEPESYRLAEVDAYYRAVKHRLDQVADLPPDLDRTYPLPTTHCDVCRWWALCTKRWRDDDHPTLVAGLSVGHLPQLAAWQVSTMTDVAGLPDPRPSRPDRGAPSTYANLRHQAARQVASRGLPVPRHDLRDFEPGKGLTRLPEPSPGDVFLDFEAARFVDEGGLEYLLGWVSLDDRDSLHYRSCWALTRADEKVLLETFIDELFAIRERHPDFHAFHFGAYDLGAIKRLATRHSTREEELDVLLREERFVDLLSVLRQGVRVGVETYSLKALEPCYGLTRKTDLRDAGAALRAVEAALERNLPDTIEPATLATVQSYNREDCISAFHARNWLEARRADLVAGGIDLTRPEIGDGAPPEQLDERTQRARAIAERLLAGVPAGPADRIPEQHPAALLAANLEWFRREQKAAWWEHYRLADLDDEERLHRSRARRHRRWNPRLPHPSIPRPSPRSRPPRRAPSQSRRRHRDRHRRWSGARRGCACNAHLGRSRGPYAGRTSRYGTSP